MMHIGLVIYGRLDGHSGGFLYDRMIVRELENFGHKVSVVELPWRRYGRGLLDNLDEGLASRLASHKWDILVEDELAHPSLIRTNRRLRKLTRQRFPIISLVHLLHSSSQPWYTWQKKLFRQVEKRYLRSLDAGIFVSQYNWHLAERLAGKQLPGLVAYPAGNHLTPSLNQEDIRRRAKQTRPLQIIYLGSVIRRKGLHTLLEALAGMESGEWHLKVIGSLVDEPAYAQQLQVQTQRAGLTDRTEFLGRIEHPQAGQHLEQGDVLVIPSYAEGYSIACLEGMACGLPVITTSTSGAVELIDPGENGYLLEPGDSQVLRQYLHMLAKDRRVLEQLSLAARRTWENHPTWAGTARKIEAFLQEQVQGISAKKHPIE